jgi:flagellar motor switch protein FliM
MGRSGEAPALKRSPKTGDVTGVTVPQPSTSTSARPTRGRPNRRSKSTGPQPYDFRRPTKLSREHVRTLQIAYETFARQYATLLTTSLRVVSHVGLVSVEQLTYDEYVSALENPTVMATFTAEPLSGTGIMELSLPTAMTFVDHLLGGPGSADQPARPMTDIETMLVRGILDRALAEFRYALESLVAVTPKLGAIEYNPQFLQIAAPSDTVVVASFEMRVGMTECLATLCIPFNSLLPRLQSAVGRGPLSAQQRAARDAAALQMADALEGAPLDVAVRFSSTMVRSEEIMGLSVGDVIPLRHSSADPLAITAGDVHFAHAVPGSHGKRLACLVVDAPQEDSA